MDKSVLLEKRKNLLASSKNAQELFLNTHFIDLLSLFVESELLNFVESNAISELKINKNDLANRISNIINDASNESDLVQALSALHTTIKLPNLKEFTSVKNKLIDEIIEEKLHILEELLEYSLNSKIEYYDTSIWNLHLSYGLMEGTISYVGHEDLLVRAPLINIEIEILRNEQGEYIIRKINDEQYGNEILGLSLDEQLEKQTGITSSIDAAIFNANEYFNKFVALLPTLTIDAGYSSITRMTKEQSSNISTLTIKKCFFACSINPVGAKMLRDYDELLSQDYQFPTYDTIFHHDLNHLIYDEDKIYEINNPLNLIQKLAVANSQNKNTLIYGPPGTGKSEVVANLIANLLLSDKNVVVISEKKAALDVLDNRLLSISALAMSAFDEKNSDVFYQKVLQLNHLIVATNKINLKLENKSYLDLLNYQKLFSQLSTYIDVNKKTIYEMLEKYDGIDLVKYQRHIEIIKFIFNKLAMDKINLHDFINNVNLLREIQIYFDGIFGEKKINNDAINYHRVDEFLKSFENVAEKDQGFVMVKFLVENEIVEKKSPLQLRGKLSDQIDIHKTRNMLQKIIDSKLTYITNIQKIFGFTNDNGLVGEYISLYDWMTNTNFQQLVDLIKQNQTSQILIKNYWDDHKMRAKHMDEIIRDHFIHNLKEKLINKHEDEIKWTELVRIANLTKRPNINKIIKEYYSILRTAFPIWILSPDATTAIVPLKQNEFDYGIFDEASQLRIERGLPLIYRCQFSIVSGDDKQLKPTSFFSRAISLDETYTGHLDNVDSLLDKAKSSNWMSFTLSNHYRSVNEQLIRFSSHYFYDDDLICITKNGKFKKSVDVFNEMGEYDRENGTNPKEANRVIQCLLTTLDIYKSAIVITFNAKQADYIQRLAQSKPELRSRIENLSLKVRSLENVQGDEGDVVIISCTFGKDKNGKFIQNFGPVNQDGGKNRINVMVTRAKEKMIVVKSFMSSDITNDKNENTFIFKSFIQYAEQIENNGDTTIIAKNQDNIVSSDVNNVIDNIASELAFDKTLVIEKNKRIGSHTMDLSISKLNTPNISLCILIDGKYQNDRYSQDIKAWVNSVDRQKYYEDRGYLTFRLNPLELTINHQAIIKSIREQII